MSKELLILDGIITMLNAGVRSAELLQKARAEGRTVTDEEYQSLLDQSDELRDQWNAADS